MRKKLNPSTEEGSKFHRMCFAVNKKIIAEHWDLFVLGDGTGTSIREVRVMSTSS